MHISRRRRRRRWRRHLASGKTRGHDPNTIFGSDVRKGPHGCSFIVHASLRGHSVFQGSVRRPKVRLRDSVNRKDVFLVPDSIREVRNQTRPAWAILREHRGCSVRQRLVRSLGRGEKAPLRMVQRLWEDGFKATHGHSWPGRHPARFQR